MKDSEQIKVNEKIITMDLWNNDMQNSSKGLNILVFLFKQ